MKIEKINENQIRCTLTREDLASRKLKLSELAYGTEKAKNLFREMMQQANFEFGFEAEDIPLMIEAIPLNAECIILIITKVEDPEELDTRFARFAPSVTEDMENIDGSDEDDFHPDDEILDIFRKLQPSGDPAPTEHKPAAHAHAENSSDQRIRLFLFTSLSRVMELAAIIAGQYEGDSTLYKEQRTGNYLLLLQQSETGRESFDRACNIASEYGARHRLVSGSNAYLSEHCETLIAHNAIGALSGN